MNLHLVHKKDDVPMAQSQASVAPFSQTQEENSIFY
jgi:hypothetical protein